MRLPARVEGRLHLLDEREREVMGWLAEGEHVAGSEFARKLVLEYVRFSGRAFPGMLVPMMRESGSMVNPARPLVIYKDMAIRLDADAVNAGLANGCEVVLEPGDHKLTVNDNKKGAAQLHFSVRLNDVVVGDGEKHFVLSGLRPIENEVLDALVAEYEQRKDEWSKAGNKSAGAV